MRRNSLYPLLLKIKKDYQFKTKIDNIYKSVDNLICIYIINIYNKIRKRKRFNVYYLKSDRL